MREAAGLTHEEVAAALGWHRSKIGRIESAQFVRLSLTDLRAMLDLYGVTGEDQREPLITLAKEARQRDWWHTYSDVLPNPHSTFIGLEAEISSIRTYQAQLVPGLLQTEDYTRAILKASRMTTRDTDEAQRFVDVRKARQDLLYQPARDQTVGRPRSRVPPYAEGGIFGRPYRLRTARGNFTRCQESSATRPGLTRPVS